MSRCVLLVTSGVPDPLFVRCLVRRTCALGPWVVPRVPVVGAGVKIHRSKKAKLGYGRGPNPAVDCVPSPCPHGKGVQAVIQRGDPSASQTWVYGRTSPSRGDGFEDRRRQMLLEHEDMRWG